jgi:hypothetical protein
VESLVAAEHLDLRVLHGNGTDTVAKKGAMGLLLGLQAPEMGEGHRDDRQQGYVLVPLPVAPVNKTDIALLPKGLYALKQVAKQVGFDVRDAYLNLDGGFDSTHNRTCIFNAGLIPNIPENPCNRKYTKRGRKRLLNAAIHALRLYVERTFMWEGKFKRPLLRFERIQQRHDGRKLMAYTLINLRAFCGV